jgi:hypothetical protein
MTFTWVVFEKCRCPVCPVAATIKEALPVQAGRQFSNFKLYSTIGCWKGCCLLNSTRPISNTPSAGLAKVLMSRACKQIARHADWGFGALRATSEVANSIFQGTPCRSPGMREAAVQTFFVFARWGRIYTDQVAVASRWSSYAARLLGTL